ncbi:MAG: hypothetical protein AMXMBFR68_17930 [Ignavibacteria bacterium]
MYNGPTQLPTNNLPSDENVVPEDIEGKSNTATEPIVSMPRESKFSEEQSINE